MNNIKISLRLWILTICIVILMIIMGILGLSGLRASHNDLEEMYNDPLAHTINLGQMLSSFQTIIIEMALAIQHAPDSPVIDLHNHAVDKHLDVINEQIQAIDKSIEIAYKTILGDVSGQEIERIKQIEVVYQDFLTNGVVKAISLIRQNKYHEADKLLITDLSTLFHKEKKLLEDFIQYNEQKAMDLYENNNQNYELVLLEYLIIVFIGALFALVFSFIIIRGIDSSVKKLQIASANFADGDLTTTIKDYYADELGDVCQSFNTMADNFRLVIAEVLSSIDQLASSSEELSATTAQTQKGFVQQQDKTSVVTSDVAKMTESLGDVKENADRATNSAKTCNQEAQQGMAIVSDTIVSINSVASELKNAAITVKSLEENTVKMSSIIEVIKGIAEQTNLLALNAAIEAARAGEQGRGFAVVADEVRTLASRTQESTEEIHKMIEQLKLGTGEAVNVMNRSQEEANKSVEKSSEADKSLQRINNAADSILHINTEIATTVDLQNIMAENINKNIGVINQIVKGATEGAHQTAIASSQLSSTAANLQGLVAKFKV